MRCHFFGVIAIYIFFLTGILPTGAFAQPAGNASSSPSQKSAVETGLFNRRSITFAPMSVSAGDYDVLAERTLAGLTKAGARFDYNLVDAATLRKGQAAFLKNKFFADSLDKPENIAALVRAVRESGILERIIQQAANGDSLTARNNRMQRRIATGAAEQQNIKNPTAENIFTIVNGAFIGFPVLSSLTVNPRDRDQITAKGFVYWMRLEPPPLRQWDSIKGTPAPETVKIIPVAQRRARGGAVRTQNQSEAAWRAEALTSFIQEVFDAASAVKELKPRATVQAVEGGEVRIDIGSREAAYLDQGYEIFETRMDMNGNLSSARKSFIRISSVGDNERKMDALSAAYPVMFGDIDIGMSAVARDQFLDILIRPRFATLFIPQASINNLLGANLIAENATFSAGLSAALLLNMAQAFGIPQLFIGIEGAAGIVPMSLNPGQQVAQGSNTPISIGQPLSLEASFVALKKFWLGGVAATVEANLGLNNLSVSGLYGGNDWTLTYGSLSFAAGLNAGLDFTVSPDLIIGVEAGYRAVLPVTAITLQQNGFEDEVYTQLTDPNVWNRGELGAVNLGGLRGGVRVTFSIPSF